MIASRRQPGDSEKSQRLFDFYSIVSCKNNEAGPERLDDSGAEVAQVK